MKTYVITVSQNFPKTHPRSGEPTNFPTAIQAGKKKHTIRGNYDLWAKRFEQINAGKAILSVRVWEGKPYNSKQRELFQLDKTVGIGLQKLKSWELESDLAFYVGKNKNVLPVGIEDLATNDGLSVADFKKWFAGADLSKPMAIIHFTDFRYYG